MVQPSTASRIDLGLIPGYAQRQRPVSWSRAAKFNPLFTHRVRVTAVT